MGDDTVPSVRERVDAQSNPSKGDCIRLQVRVDLYPGEPLFSWSFIGWTSPGGELIANEVGSEVDTELFGRCCYDLASSMAQALRLEVDPFP